MRGINLRLLRSKLVKKIEDLKIVKDSGMYGNQIKCGLSGEIFAYQKVIDYLDGKIKTFL